MYDVQGMSFTEFESVMKIFSAGTTIVYTETECMAFLGPIIHHSVMKYARSCTINFIDLANVTKQEPPRIIPQAYSFSAAGK